MYVGIRRLAARLAILFGLALVVVFLGAQTSTPAAAYTPDQQAACESDAMRLCGQYVPDIRSITACMRRNCRFASARCRAVMHCSKRRRR